MFKKEDGGSSETIIANGVKVEGDFASPGNVRIEGIVKGKVKAEGSLLVTETASIEADVEASSATVAGALHGDIKIGDKLEIMATARIYGNVSCRNLSVESGALISGNCQVSPETAAAKSRVREREAEAVEA